MPRALAWVVPLSAGFAFVLPTSTPALAMVFGTGYLRIRHSLPGVIVTALSLVFMLVMIRFAWPHLGLESLRGAP